MSREMVTPHDLQTCPKQTFLSTMRSVFQSRSRRGYGLSTDTGSKVREKSMCSRCSVEEKHYRFIPKVVSRIELFSLLVCWRKREYVARKPESIYKHQGVAKEFVSLLATCLLAARAKVNKLKMPGHWSMKGNINVNVGLPFWRSKVQMREPFHVLYIRYLPQRKTAFWIMEPLF